MEELLRSKTGEQCFINIMELNLSNSRISSLEMDVLNKCSNMKVLDISRNQLNSLSGIFLPSLETLNIEDNSIADVTFLCGLPLLRKLYFDGNPLSVADRYITVDQLPHLNLLDGKSCDEIQKAVKEFEERLKSQVSLIYSSKYMPLLSKCSDQAQFMHYKRNFIRELLNKISACSRLPPKYQRFKVQTFVDRMLTDVQPDFTPNSEKSNKRSQFSSPSSELKNLKNLQLNTPGSVEKRFKSLSVSSPNSLEKNMSEKFHGCPSSLSRSERQKKTIKCASPSKLRKRKLNFDVDDERGLMYEPQVFLRCHSQLNNPQNCNTQVWAASFEPDINVDGHTTDLVATCGGNIVCFINCGTGHIFKRYKCESLSENLFALSWTVLQANNNRTQKTTALAVGGAEKRIYLIHPSQLKCYSIFKAHAQAINVLQFHPIEETWLFSGGNDRYVHVWNIGNLSLPDYKSSHQKLMTFDAKSEIIQIVISQHYNCLFTASHAGLKAWSLDGKPDVWARRSCVSLIIPDSCKSDESDLVDGLTLVSQRCLGVKVSQSGKIFIVDVSNVFPNGKLTRKQTCELSSVAQYLWSDCNSDYNYIHSSEHGGVLACGDNSGHLWIYDVQRYKENVQTVDNDILLPAVMLPWPSLQFETEELSVKTEIITNSVRFNWNGEYLIACTDSNLVCIWKQENSPLVA